MKILTLLYTLYGVIIFLLLCLFYVPLMVLLCQRKAWHHLALRIHTVWAWNFFLLAFIRVKVERRFRPKRGERYVFCANHFSYLDIPALFLVLQAKFIGKSSLSRIPLFGYFYRKIHITVNRASVRSRAESLLKTKEAIDEGFNVTFFPEGGVKIKEEDIPDMVPFRNGAFILSVEKNIPVVPITLPFNYRIIPDKSPLRIHPNPCTLIIHEPVYPRGNSEAEITRMRDEVYRIIQEELYKYHPEKVDSVH